MLTAQQIDAYRRDGYLVIPRLIQGEQLAELRAITDRIVAALRAGRRLFFCGNGGSAADAQHLATEFRSHRASGALHDGIHDAGLMPATQRTAARLAVRTAKKYHRSVAGGTGTVLQRRLDQGPQFRRDLRLDAEPGFPGGAGLMEEHPESIDRARPGGLGEAHDEGVVVDIFKNGEYTDTIATTYAFDHEVEEQS